MSKDVYPDVAVVRAEARAAWEAQYKRRLTLQERIGASVPWWLVIIAAMFFALSAPHTAAVFDLLTPGMGVAAPLAVEFGLLYAAFDRRKRKSQDRSRSQPVFTRVLETLLFVTAVVVNGAGSFMAVVAASGDIQGLSLTDLWLQFDGLPASSQLALLLVPMAALIIPIGTAVAGEGVASLILERREQGDVLAQEWARVKALIEFEALRDAALGAGITAGKATQWAENITGYRRDDSAFSAVRPSGQTDKRTDSVRTEQQADNLLDRDRRDGHNTGQGYTKRMDARELVWTYLEDNPDAAEWTVRDLASAVGVGKTTAADVRGQFMEHLLSRNGHGGE